MDNDCLLQFNLMTDCFNNYLVLLNAEGNQSFRLHNEIKLKRKGEINELFCYEF